MDLLINIIHRKRLVIKSILILLSYIVSRLARLYSMPIMQVYKDIINLYESHCVKEDIVLPCWVKKDLSVSVFFQIKMLVEILTAVPFFPRVFFPYSVHNFYFCNRTLPLIGRQSITRISSINLI